MILSDTVTSEGRSEQFALYEPGTATVRYDVHVRVEPASETVAMLMVYDRDDQDWAWILGMCADAWERQFTGRIAAEVWKRYGKRVPAEVLA